jgi:hypothetical protein
MRSIVLVALCSMVWAALLSPASIAFLTFFTAVRSSERRLALCWRCCSLCRERFLAEAVFAM